MLSFLPKELRLKNSNRFAKVRELNHFKVIDLGRIHSEKLNEEDS